jgi:chromosome segregation protein
MWGSGGKDSMRVKRLEIQGFKSFKDKTIIHFDHGITGIVGPNGCGKSNIVDAFFWVMGEQSYKHMRGSGSDDLIFNGSTRYSPLGMAEATLVLETSAPAAVGEDAPAGATIADVPPHLLKGKEVSVTRRLYRGGEGEYFINGVPARLKDIHELFMDTGVGAKGYSVIEQGQIGKIVNAKPEERRLLIEEAAGIAKYKARKKESLRKMEATQANLSRLNDVIQEIERNLGSLERQAQKARQFKKYKEELLDKEMTWGRRKIQVLRQKLEALTKQKELLEIELVGLRAELQVAENAIEVDRVEQVTDSKVAEEWQSKIQQLSDDLTHEKSALDLSRRRQSDLNSQLEALETEKQELQVSLETERERLATRTEEASHSDEDYARAAEAAREMDTRVRAVRAEADALRRELESTKRDLMNGITNSSALTSKAASLLGRMESAQAKIQRLEQQVEEHSGRLESQRDEATLTATQAEETRLAIENLRNERREQQQAVQSHEQNLRQLEKSRDESLRSLTQLKSRMQSLEELSAAHEGFGDGPKAALDWVRENGNQGKILSLADALEVNSGFETALEGWLENRLESLISGEAGLALEAVNQVSNDKQGRVAIHIAEAQDATAASDMTAGDVRAALEGAGFEVEGELTQFVGINHRIDTAMQDRARNTISHVMVVKSLSPLATFAGQGGMKKLGGWSIVSMDGSAMGADGILRGGHMETDGGASLLRRKNAIAELGAQVAAADAEHQLKETAVTEIRQALDIARARLQTLQTELQGLEVQVAALDRDVHQMNRAIKDAERQLESFSQEREELEAEARSAIEERAEIEEELATFNAAKAELDAKIAEGEAKVAAKDAELRTQEDELNALRVNEASLRERAGSIQRELESAKALITDRERRLNEINRTLERATREREEFSGGESGMQEKIEELTLALAKAKEELAQVKDRLEQNNAKANAALERIKFLHKTGDQKTAETNQLALELEKISLEMTHLTQNLEEKYGPGCLERPVTSPIQEEMSEPVVTAEMTAEEEAALGEEVERLRERIRRLGEVNVMAIEEFEELKKRYDYLLGEKNDLEHSIENLQEAIEHINKTSEERFKKAFEAIADRFQRLFPIIFGGGQARLSLVYPEGSTDILDAGVDILAQPPGKKVVNIGLLSGGEKALTAVSLIFAIFLVKPSPFCVLDEVDAPLDDANIGKFNALLREMSAKSQFILITHNKKTMELNDTLYGVTMEEPGVSKMVSIEMH